MKRIFALAPAATLSRKVAPGCIADRGKRFGAKPSTFGANTQDAGPSLESEKDIVGCRGVFNTSPSNHDGMDERASARHDPQRQVPAVARVTSRAAAPRNAMSR